jgi:hypothetical protein
MESHALCLWILVAAVIKEIVGKAARASWILVQVEISSALLMPKSII